MYLVGIAAWLFLASMVGKVAQERGREFWPWFALSTFLTPPIAMVALIFRPLLRYQKSIDGPNGVIKVEVDPSTAPRFTDVSSLAGLTMMTAIFAGAVYIVPEIESTPSLLPSSSAPSCGSPTMAYFMSQEFVKQRLKSPSTASFPGYHASGVSSTPSGGCGYVVRSYVDSQNSFGATLRSNYAAEMKYDPGAKTWEAADLSIQ